MVWGSDWPHPTEKTDTKPDDAILFDLLTDWAPDEATRSRILGRQPGGAVPVRLAGLRDVTPCALPIPYARHCGHGQIYLPPSGALKQPTDSGNSVFGSQSTAFGKKIAKAIVAKKIT